MASSHGGGDLRQMNVREHDLPGDHHVGRYNGMRPLNQQNARAAGPRECQGMEMPKLDCILVEPNIAAERTVIWLHGLGADGHDFEPIVPELHLAPELAVRFVFPNAPSIPVTINGGFVMPAWYDILKMDLERELDVGQLLASAEGVRELIVAENEKGIPSDRILLAGFSQGGGGRELPGSAHSSGTSRWPTGHLHLLRDCIQRQGECGQSGSPDLRRPRKRGPGRPGVIRLIESRVPACPGVGSDLPAISNGARGLPGGDLGHRQLDADALHQGDGGVLKGAEGPWRSPRSYSWERIPALHVPYPARLRARQS